jgi:hypothetical protein
MVIQVVVLLLDDSLEVVFGAWDTSLYYGLTTIILIFFTSWSLLANASIVPLNGWQLSPCKHSKSALHKCSLHTHFSRCTIRRGERAPCTNKKFNFV